MRLRKEKDRLNPLGYRVKLLIELNSLSRCTFLISLEYIIESRRRIRTIEHKSMLRIYIVFHFTPISFAMYFFYLWISILIQLDLMMIMIIALEICRTFHHLTNGWWPMTIPSSHPRHHFYPNLNWRLLVCLLAACSWNVINHNVSR